MEFYGILSVYCSIQFIYIYIYIHIYICIYIYIYICVYIQYIQYIHIYTQYININKYEVKGSRPSCRDRVLGPRQGAMGT